MIKLVLNAKHGDIFSIFTLFISNNSFLTSTNAFFSKFYSSNLNFYLCDEKDRVQSILVYSMSKLPNEKFSLKNLGYSSY